MSLHVYVEDNAYGGLNIYRVIVDHAPYDQFVSDRTLTWAEQADVAAGYKEALDGYPGPGVDFDS